MLRFRFIKIHQPESKLRKIYAEPSHKKQNLTMGNLFSAMPGIPCRLITNFRMRNNERQMFLGDGVTSFAFAKDVFHFPDHGKKAAGGLIYIYIYTYPRKRETTRKYILSPHARFSQIIARNIGITFVILSRNGNNYARLFNKLQHICTCRLFFSSLFLIRSRRNLQ